MRTFKVWKKVLGWVRFSLKAPSGFFSLSFSMNSFFFTLGKLWDFIIRERPLFKHFLNFFGFWDFRLLLLWRNIISHSRIFLLLRVLLMARLFWLKIRRGGDFPNWKVRILVVVVGVMGIGILLRNFFNKSWFHILDDIFFKLLALIFNELLCVRHLISVWYLFNQLYIF